MSKKASVKSKATNKVLFLLLIYYLAVSPFEVNWSYKDTDEYRF